MMTSCSMMQNSCKECKKMPFRIDGKRPISSFSCPISSVPSFFKVMLGDFGKAMFIPPKFALNLEGMINKDIYLEDSYGTCWMVKLCKVDGSLAFEQGWHDFVSDHSISKGEFVIFKHISISLFTVQIYGTSGSERLQFKTKENSNERKRKRSKNETTPDILCLVKAQRSYEDSEGKHGAPDKGSTKRYRAEKTFPCALASSEMAARSHSIRAVGEHTDSLKEYPRHPHDFGPEKLHNSSTVGYLKAPHKIIDRGKRVEEADINSPIILSDDEDDENSGTAVIAKNGLFLHADKFKGQWKTSVEDHLRNRKEDLSLHKSSINRPLLITEKKSSMVCQDAVHEREVIVVSPTNSTYPGTSQSKKNSKGTSVTEVNKEKMPVHEKEMTVVHIIDRKRDLAACNKSDNSYLLALERKYSEIDNTAVCKQEVIQITPIMSVYLESSQSTRNSQDTNIMEANEEKLSDQRNIPKIHKIDSREDCTQCDIEIPVEDSSAIINQALAEDRVPMVGCSQEQNIFAKDHMANRGIKRNSMSEPETFPIKLDSGSFVENNCERPETETTKLVEDEDGNLIISKEFTHKSVLIGEGICYTADEDSEDKIEVISDASSDLCTEKVECNSLDANKGVARETSYLHENSPEVPSGAPILNHNADDSSQPRTWQEINCIHSEGDLGNRSDSLQARTLHEINYIQSEGNLGNRAETSQARTLQEINYSQSEGYLEKENIAGNPMDPLHARIVKSTPLVMADTSGSHVDQSHRTTAEGEHSPLAIVPGEILETNAEKIASCSKGKILTIVKTEVMDPGYKHPNTMEDDPFLSVPGEFRALVDEKVTPCSKGEVLAVVKTEIMNPIDNMQLNHVKYSTTVSLISQSWLLLPERLPAHLFKKRCLRKVVLLQDPSMRLWPVLYHENLNFIGFLGGWEDFATANNLQLGDTCQIKFASASEPTFKVHFSNVQNPT